jgi:hypothetical protein
VLAVDEQVMQSECFKPEKIDGKAARLAEGLVVHL